MENLSELKEEIKKSILNSYPDLSEFNNALKKYDAFIKKEHIKIWCSECNGEDEASICKWCYQNAVKTGRQQEKDIKADHLAGHYIVGKEEGKKEAIAEEIKFLEYLIDSYFLVCVGESPQTPRTDILLRIKTLKNENIKKGVSRSKVDFKGWEKNGKNKITLS